MPKEKDMKAVISNSFEEHKKHYRKLNNGLATDEDDLPDRQMISESVDESDEKDEYIDEF